MGGSMSYFDDVFEPMLYKVPSHTKRHAIERSLHDGVWLSKNGPIKMSDMSDDHIRNCIRLCERRGASLDGLAISCLKDELSRRPLNAPEGSEA